MQKTTIACWILIIMFASLLWVGAPVAQDYPKGPVQIVIPFAPGGATDILWRNISDFLAKNINGPVALVNKTGGGGVVGISFVVNSKPDGYTLTVANSDSLNITPLFTPDIPFDMEKDLTYLGKMAIFPQSIAVRAESPFKTLEELIAFAKANPKKLKSGCPGVGTSPYMAIEMFNRDAKIEISAVPFGGGGEVVPNLLGGHVDLAFVAIPPIKSQVLSGKARILAILSPTRLPGFPQVPTVVEKGYRKSTIATGVGLAGPKGLIPAIVKKWEEAIEKTMKDPKVVATIEKFDFVADFKSGEAYKKEILAEYATFKEIVPTPPGKK